MADVGIVEGELLEIRFSNGLDPEALTHSCLINTERKIAFTSNVTEKEVADCANQSAPAKIARKVKSIDFTVTGAGTVDKTSVPFMLNWWKTGAKVHSNVVQNLTGAEGGFTGDGYFILKDFDLGGTRGDYQDFTGTFLPALPFDWQPNA